MKKIEAIIRKTKFEDVKEALLAADIVRPRPEVLPSYAPCQSPDPEWNEADT